MATFAARRLQPMIANTRASWPSSGWRPRRASNSCARWPVRRRWSQAHALLRGFSPAMMTDRSLAPDIEAAALRIGDGSLTTIFRGRPDMPPLWVAV
jgi:histidine ammonia-lyase